MYKEYLFIDGYNILNSWSRLKRSTKVDLETARNKLIDIMIEYSAYTGARVIIVFDAHMVKKGLEKVKKLGEVEIVYTKENETADSYIERVLDDIGRKNKVRVATSDRAEQQLIFSRGGSRVSARELELEVDSYKKNISRNQERNSHTSDVFMGGLSDKNLEVLKKWREKNEE